MQVRHRFSGVWAGIDDQPVATLLEAGRRGDLSRLEQEMPQQRPVLRTRFSQARDRLAGDDQKVGWSLRIDVVEGHDLFVFVHEPSWQFTSDDSLKHSAGHGGYGIRVSRKVQAEVGALFRAIRPWLLSRLGPPVTE